MLRCANAGGTLLLVAVTSGCGATSPGPTNAKTEATVEIPAPGSAEVRTTEAPPKEKETESFDLFGFQRARIENAKVMGTSVEAAVELWQVTHSDRCPSVEDLVKDLKLDPRLANDPWDMPFMIQCESDRITVSSSGPDKQRGTTDDIVATPLSPP